MRRPGGIAGWVLLAALLWLIAYPLALVLVHAVRGADGWTLEYVRTFLARPTEWRALWDSLWISVASVVGAAPGRGPRPRRVAPRRPAGSNREPLP